MKLYELALWERDLAERIDAAEAVEESVSVAELDALCEQFADKIEGCCRVLRNQQAEADALKAEADHLADRARTAASKADWLKRYVFQCMQAAGERKLKAGIFSLTIQSNSQPSVTVTVPPESLPAEFQSVKVEANKTALLEAHKASKELPPGVEIATGCHLRIR